MQPWRIHRRARLIRSFKSVATDRHVRGSCLVQGSFAWWSVVGETRIEKCLGSGGVEDQVLFMYTMGFRRK